MRLQRRGAERSWWEHLPPHQRLHRRFRVLLLRFRDAMGRRPFLISALITAYAAICLGVLFSGTGTVAFLAALPLLLVPAVGCLAYWLLWKEFHH